MISISDIKMPLDFTKSTLKSAVSRLLRMRLEDLPEPILLKKAVDARKKEDVHFSVTVGVALDREETVVKKLNNPKMFSLYFRLFLPPLRLTYCHI